VSEGTQSGWGRWYGWLCTHVPVSPVGTHLDLHDHCLGCWLHEVAQSEEAAEHWEGTQGTK